MSKFLMFDHDGVLTGNTLHLNDISENDLVLEEYDWGDVQVLKNGVSIIQSINKLIKDHDYEVVFHSKNREAAQIEIWEQLRLACEQKGLEFPKVRAMAVFDKAQYSNSSDQPQIMLNQHNITMACWGSDDLDGKGSVRRALENLLEIKPEERNNHIVFDDGEPIVTAARNERYQAFLIGENEEGRVTLDKALSQVLLNQLPAVPEVVIYTDFDGTITKRSGSQLVFTPFYKSLLIDEMGDYHESPMKEPKELQVLFEKKFGEYNQSFDWNQKDTDILMSIEAVNFLHKIVKNPKVCANIVTKNRQEYIQALLKYQGFSEGEIRKITIYDSGSKGEDLTTDINIHQYKNKHMFIFDDDRKDFDDMCFAVSSNTTHAYHKDVGQFEWNNYLEEIERLIVVAQQRVNKFKLLTNNCLKELSSNTETYNIVQLSKTTLDNEDSNETRIKFF